MLDDVQRRALGEQPARMDAVPLLVDFKHIDLNEGAGQLVRFPGSRLVASLQADDHVADPNRLARLELELTGLAVALVEQAEHRDPVLHRRRRCILDRLAVAIDRDHVGRLTGRITAIGGNDLVRGRILRRSLVSPTRACTEGEQQPDRSGSSGAKNHAPGVQAS